MLKMTMKRIMVPKTTPIAMPIVSAPSVSGFESESESVREK